MTTLSAQIRFFAHHHDEVPAFHAGYLVLTLLAAAMFNLGFFGMLILFHMLLDVLKYRELHRYSWRMTLRGIAKESLFDVMLFSAGLVFAIYFHHAAGVAGLSGLLRAEATIIRALGTMIPKMKILQRILAVVSHLRHYIAFVHPEFHMEWSAADQRSAFFIVVSFMLIALSPFALELAPETFLRMLAGELIPWRL